MSRACPPTPDVRPDDEPEWLAWRQRCVNEARRWLRDEEHAAEDVAHEALVRAWRRWDSCNSDSARAGWLSAITRNEALRWRSKRTRGTVLSDWDNDSLAVIGHSDPVERQLQLLLVRDELATLSTADRELIELRYEKDLTQQEIATRLSMPLGTVKANLHRLRQRLRVQLA